MIFALVSIAILLFVFRNAKRKHVGTYMKIVAVALPILEIAKVTWESVWDVKTGHGFNWEGLLPIYTCSLFMYCVIVAAFSKGKLGRWCLSWVCTIGFVGGMSNVLFIRGLKWYPFFTFGAMHSMLFHYVMVFTALLPIVTGYVRFSMKDTFGAFIVHTGFSVPVIALDYIFGWDYMQYYSAGGVPLIEGIVDKFTAGGVRFLAVPLMLALYFALDAIFAAIYTGYGKLRFGRKKQDADGDDDEDRI